MPTPDSLPAALEQIAALEAELSRLRQKEGARSESEKMVRQAKLDAATASTVAQIEQARMQTELQTIQMQAELVEHDREEYVGRLNALAAELSEEIGVLLSFSREQAASYYEGRVAREREAVVQAEAAHAVARRTLAKKEAEARASGQRTITEMAELDLALNAARAEEHATSVTVRETRRRVELLEGKLVRAKG